jgi:hypothetical protein
MTTGALIAGFAGECANPRPFSPGKTGRRTQLNVMPALLNAGSMPDSSEPVTAIAMKADTWFA